MPKNSQKGVIGLVGIILIGVALVSVTISATKIAPQIKEAVLSKLQGSTPTSAPAPASPSPSLTPEPSYRDPGGKSYCGGKFNSCCSDCRTNADCTPGAFCQSFATGDECGYSAGCVWPPASPTPRPSVSPTPTPRSSASPVSTSTPQPSRSGSPQPTQSPVPFEPYCSATGEWKSGQTCCYDCSRNSDCSQGTCRYDEVCGSYCLLPSTASSSPTPEASPTPQASKSQELLPGNFLYPLKNISRGMRVLFTFDQSRKAQLYLDFANEKIDEIYILADKGRLQDATSGLKSYTSDLENATKITTKLTESRSKQQLSKKILVDGFNHQLLLRLIEEAAPSERQKGVQETRENAVISLTQITQGVDADVLKDTVTTLITKNQSPLKTLGYAQTLEELKPHVSDELKKVIDQSQILVRAKLKTTVSNLKKEQKDLYFDELKAVSNDPETLKLIENAEEGKIVVPEDGSIPQFNTPEEYLEWFKKFYNFESIPLDESFTQPTSEENSPEPEEQ